MVRAGDPGSRSSAPIRPSRLTDGEPDFTVPLVHLLFASAALAALLYILSDWFEESKGVPSDARLIVIAGLGGSLGSSLASTLLPTPTPSRDRKLAPILATLGGFGASSLIFMLVRSLLFLGPSSRPNTIGIAVFGAIVGTVLVALIGQAIRLTTEGISSVPLMAALDTLESRLHSGARVNYAGYLAVGWYPKSERVAGITALGVLRLRLLPGLADTADAEQTPNLGLPGESPAPRPNITQTARVLVEGGIDEEQATFQVSLITDSSLELSPSRFFVNAPLDLPSETRTVSFHYIGGGLLPPDPVQRSITVLIDIAQGGETIQTIELDFPIMGGI